MVNFNNTEVAFTGRLGEKTMPDIHEGDLLVQPAEPRLTVRDQRNQTKPTSRDVQPKQTLLTSTNQLPGNHVTCNAPKQFNWSSNDKEKFRERQLQLGLTPRQGTRPTRKNI